MPLPILNKNSISHTNFRSPRQERKIRLQEYWNLQWKNTHANTPSFLMKLRTEFVQSLLEAHVFEGNIAYLGCGEANMLNVLGNNFQRLDLIDISTSVLQYAKNQHKEREQVRYIHEAMPYTRMPDNSYDHLLCLDLIAHCEAALLPLFVNECARILKTKGLLYLSSPLDQSTQAPLESLINLFIKDFSINNIWGRNDRIWKKIQPILPDKWWNRNYVYLSYLDSRLRNFMKPSYVMISMEKKQHA